MSGETTQNSNPQGEVLSEAEARDLISEYAGTDTGENQPDATSNGAPADETVAEFSSPDIAKTSDAPEHTLSDEKLSTIKEAMGKTALIATGMSKEDIENARIEVVSKNTAKTIEKHAVLQGITVIPAVGYIVGNAIKIGIAAKHRHDFNKAVANSDTLEEAYNRVGLDITQSRILNSSSEQTKDRAMQILENAGYDENNQINEARSRLDENDVVKRDEKAEQVVRQALTDYYSNFKDAKDDAAREEASRKFDAQVKAAFAGKENLGTSIDLQQQKTGIEQLVQNKDIDIVKEDISTYLEQHMSLYKADIKEGVYTKNKVDKVTNVVGAVAAAGVAGGILAFIAGREGRSELRAATGAATTGLAANPTLKGGLTGAVVGGTFGGIRGWQNAGYRLSDAEIKAATTFDDAAPEAAEATSSETPEASPALDSDMILDEPVAPDQPNTPYEIDEKAWLEWGDKQKEYEEKLAKYKELATEPVAPDQPNTPYEIDEKAWLEWGDKQKEYEEKLARHKEFLRLREERDKTGNPAEATEVSNEGAGEETNESEKTSEKKGLKARIVGKIAEFKRKRTHEDELFAAIEKKRDRKNASDLTKDLKELMEDNSPEAKSKLLTLYAEIIARGRFSSNNKVDLIKYKDDDRTALEAMLHSAEEKMDFNVDEAFKNEDSDLNKAIKAQYEELEKNYKEARNLEIEYRVRSAAVDAVTGAVIGAAAGIICTKLMATKAVKGAAQGVGHLKQSIGEAIGLIDKEDGIDIDQLEGDQVELVEDPDGGYTVKIGGQEIIGEGDAKGIDFNSDGTLTDESKEMLEGAGFDIQDIVTEHHFESAVQHIGIKEFFDPSNKEANDLTEISDRSWVTGNNGGDQILMGGTHMDSEGNIIINVEPSQSSGESLDGMKLLLTPGNGNIDTGVTVDVNPDGTIEIPANSPAASFFDGNSFKGGYGEIIREGANGHVDVYATPFINRGSTLSSITVPDSEAVWEEHDYVLTAGDREFDVNIPEEITDNARFEALNGIESLKGVAGEIGYESNGEATTLTTTSGEAVEVEHFEHRGGYSDTVDSYFGEKDGVYNSGASIVRQMVGNQGEGLSSQEVDRIFLNKVANGEIQEGDVVEEYLKTMGNSPEAITTTRAMLGDFKFDIDGDGTPELIDTQDEINLASDIISRDPEAYDAFVNDTNELFYEKIAGGQIRFVDYSSPNDQYQYTTWGVRGEDNNILQRLGQTGNRTTDGVGIVFVDKYGNSIYDEATVRKLWNLPDDYDIRYIGDRLNCIQKTAHGVFNESTGDEPTGDEPTGDEPTGDEPTGDEPTGDEPTGDEPTGDEPTGDEPTGDEPTGDEPTGDEPTGDEPTGDEPTGDEPTGDEPTGDEPTGDEPTGDEPTGDEPTGDEPTGDEPTGDEPTGDEPTGDEPSGDEVTPKTDDPHAGDETDLPVTPEQEDDYVQPTQENHVDPDTQPGSQVNDAPTDDSAFNPVDHDTSSGEDTQSTYSEDTSKWHGDTSDNSDPTPPPSNANPGSAEENNAPRSDEELANILEGEE